MNEEVIDALAEYMNTYKFPTKNSDILLALPTVVEEALQSTELLEDANIVVKGYMLMSDARDEGDPKSPWTKILTYFAVERPHASCIQTSSLITSELRLILLCCFFPRCYIQS